jgi:hypothetical protein
MKFLIVQLPPFSRHFIPLLGPDILLRTLFSNTLSLCSSLSVRDQASHPYKTQNVIKKLNSFYFPVVSNWNIRPL